MASIIVPATLLTQLQAVNILIASLGESPIASITPAPTSDADEAIARLNEVDLEVQSEGWHWNREKDFQLTLNNDGTITLPDETLRMANAYASEHMTGTPLEVTARGAALYDMKNHTNVFTTAPYVDLVIRLDWDSLPQVARAYITHEAARRFHAGKVGSQIVLEVNQENLQRARLTLEQYEDEQAGENTVYGNASVVTALFGIGGMRRNRGGL